jgi:membrane-bound lytic murein transglycosylase MltF
MKLRVLRVLILLALLSANAFPQEAKPGGRTDAWRMRAKIYEPLIVSTAQRYNVDPRLLWTIAYLESRFREDVVSYKNGKPCAYGMMQFTMSTARRYGLTNPHNLRDSIDAAARYVRDLQTRFGPRLHLILAAYNAGEGTIEAFRDGKTLVLPNNKVINPRGLRTGGIPPYKETRRYVARGGVIYEKLTRAAIFQETTSVDKASQDNALSNPMRVNAGRQDSFYSSGITSNPLAQPTVKPARSNRNNSIYVN